MIGRFLLEQSQTKKGESSILIILIFAGIVTFIMLPLLAITFEKGLVRLATQEITDAIDVSAYSIFQEISFEALSEMTIKSTDKIVESMNDNLTVNHPQIESLIITEVNIVDADKSLMTIEFDMIMNPTLYRSMYQLDHVYKLNHSVLLPIDGER